MDLLMFAWKCVKSRRKQAWICSFCSPIVENEKGNEHRSAHFASKSLKIKRATSIDQLISLQNVWKRRGQRASICSFRFKIVENEEGNGHVAKISKNPLFGGFASGVCAGSHQSTKGRVQSALPGECQEATVQFNFLGVAFAPVHPPLCSSNF